MDFIPRGYPRLSLYLAVGVSFCLILRAVCTTSCIDSTRSLGLGNFMGTPMGGQIMSHTHSHAGDVPMPMGQVFEGLYHRIL